MCKIYRFCLGFILFANLWLEGSQGVGPIVAYDLGDNKVVLWSNLEGEKGTTIQSTTYLSNRGWSRPRVISGRTNLWSVPVVVKNQHDQIVVAWEAENRDGSCSLWAVMGSLNKWARPVQISSADEDARNRDIFMTLDDEGNLFVTWSASFLNSTSGTFVRAVEGIFNGKWGEPYTLSK